MFDGDESNLNLASSMISRAEQRILMASSAPCNVANAQTNRTVVGLAFDSITGSYQLTSDSTKFTKKEFYQLLMAITRPYDVKRLEEKGRQYGLITFDEQGEPIYSGKLLFSATLPVDFFYEYVDDKNVVSIKEGILISGRLSSKTIGAGHNSIIQELHKFYPRYQPSLYNEETEVVKFITDATFLLDKYLAHVGFTIGMEDCVMPEKERADQEKIIEESFLEALRASYKISKKLENPLEEEKREAQIKRYLDTAKAVGGKVSKIAKEDNTLLAMIKSGAKGNETNFSQIGSMLGQMFYKGNRFPMTITDKTRCSPYFEPGSLDIRARGFCVNSFLTGLSPSELFFSQASGRLGLMDTALKTADVGDMRRRMVKILEDIRVSYDGTVRNNNKRIFQFVYGEDGMDASELKFVQTPNGNVPMFVDVFKEARRLNYIYSKPSEQ
jgi:DNA-directed RNA polymerase beta' subunit